MKADNPDVMHDCTKGDGHPAVFSIVALASLGLTEREAEVLFWMAGEKSNLAIARTMGCSEGTVRKHMEHLYRKLGVQTRTGAVMAALELLGVISLAAPAFVEEWPQEDGGQPSG